PHTTNMPTVSDHLLDLLAAWNVHRIFCYPGDGINGIMGSLQRANADPANPRFDVVQAAHEELAGLMATAHAKFTGEVGVCLATSIGIRQSTIRNKVMNLFSGSRARTNKRRSTHSDRLSNKETRHRVFMGLLTMTRKLA